MSIELSYTQISPQILIHFHFQFSTSWSSSQTFAVLHALYNVVSMPGFPLYGLRIRKTWPTLEHGTTNTSPPQSQTFNRKYDVNVRDIFWINLLECWIQCSPNWNWIYNLIELDQSKFGKKEFTPKSPCQCHIRQFLWNIHGKRPINL